MKQLASQKGNQVKIHLGEWRQNLQEVAVVAKNGGGNSLAW
jgi:hypothetical protein